MQLGSFLKFPRILRDGAVGAAILVALMACPTGAAAQSPFSPAIKVNNAAITYFELDQRAQFLRLLRAPGDPVEEAREALIEDRLKQQAYKDAGIEVTPEDIQAGIEEFASRSELSAEEFIQALGQGGVVPETMRDFTEVSLGWREYVSGRFLARARPSKEEIDKALGRAGGTGVQVLLSEIVIPVTAQTVGQVEGLAEQISQISSEAEFAEAAAQYSAADSRTNGGRLDWLTLNKLPPGLRPVVLGLSPGETSAPIAVPEAVILFHMRGIQETGAVRENYSAIDYAMYYIAGGRTSEALQAAASISSRIDNCDDLYGIAKGQPPSVLVRESQKPGAIPRDIAMELAKLDEGEISTNLTRNNGQTLVLLMMCGRTGQINDDASREEIAQALTQKRIETFSNSYLAQLRANALIVEE